MLRIATSQIYQQSAKNMGERQVALVKIQQQYGDWQAPADQCRGSGGSARLLSLNEELGRYDQYQRNTDLANSRLNVEETSLEGANEVLQYARELVVQANNAPLNNSDRRDIAIQIRQLHGELVDLRILRMGMANICSPAFRVALSHLYSMGTSKRFIRAIKASA